MAFITFSPGGTAKSADVNSNFANCVACDTSRTVTVTHTFTASQTFTGGWTAGAACTVSTGGLTVTAGGLTVTAGGVTVTAGSLVFGASASKIVPGATSLSLRNNADSADNLIISDAGVIQTRGAIAASAVGGDLVLGYNRWVRGGNSAGTDTVPLIRTETAGAVTFVQIGSNAIVGIGAIASLSGAAGGDIVIGNGKVFRTVNNAGTAAIRVIELTGASDNILIDGSGKGAQFGGSVAVGGGAAVTKWLSTTYTRNPALIAEGAAEAFTVAVTGAAVGDLVVIDDIYDGLITTGYVSAADTVRINLWNPSSTAALDCPQATGRIWVIKF